jgi:hypothetical protein
MMTGPGGQEEGVAGNDVKGCLGLTRKHKQFDPTTPKKTHRSFGRLK